MTIQEAYLRYLDLVNRNATNNNVNVDKPRFVLLYNDMQNRYVEWVLDKRNEDEIRYIQRILVNNAPLTNSFSNEDYMSFALPVNYFEFDNVSVKAKKGECEDRRMLVWEIKSENREELLEDEFNKPSFEYSETFYYLSEDSILFYRDNFDITDVRLTYYRYPNKVDISGYIKEDGSSSSDIDPEFDDKLVQRILIAMAKEFTAINSEVNDYQINKDRLFTKI
jgi:hypothetical protein